MKKLEKISDLRPDSRNANLGSVRGSAALSESMSRYGAGRSVLADKNGKLIAGNWATESWYANGGDEDIIVVQSDGTKLVVVQRTDLDLDTDRAARELAHADNRVNQLGYTPDIGKLSADILEGCDLDWLWRRDELDALKALSDDIRAEDEAPLDLDKQVKNIGFEIVVVCNSEDEMKQARSDIQNLGYYTK